MKRIAFAVGLVALVVVALVTLTATPVATPVALAGPITPTGWRPPACSAGSGIAATGTGLAYQCAAVSGGLTNTAGSGYVPTTTDGSGDLGPSGIHDTGSGSAASIKLDNTPSGIGHCAGQHVEWTQEWLDGPHVWASGAEVTNGYTAAIEGSAGTIAWQSHDKLLAFTGFSGTGTVAEISASGHPGVLSLRLTNQVGGVSAQAAASSQNIFYFTSGSINGIRGLVGISATAPTSTPSLHWEMGFATGGNDYGCFWQYDPAKLSFATATGQWLTAVCKSSSGTKAYTLNTTTTTCDSSFAATSVAVSADSSFTANLLDLGVVVDNSTGTPVAHFYSGSTEVCRISTDIPSTSTAEPMYTGWFTSNSAWTSATYGLDIDWTKEWITEPARCAALLPGE